MSTATNKQRVLNQVFGTLRKRYQSEDPEQRPVLEQFVYAVLREGATREQADRAYQNLQQRFFDWNEIRVSSPHEVEEALAELPCAEARAQRLISLLQEVFETTFSFDLEPLQKKGVKQAAKHLSRYQAASDFTAAWIVQQSLGGHAIPVDEPTRRVVQRLGLVDAGQDDPESLRSTLEHLVPKARGQVFGELVSALADELCHEEEPQCSACPMCGECLSGQEFVRLAPVGAGRSGRTKPR